MNKKSYSLLELNTFIKRILALNFDQDIWVKAEILSLNIKKGHYYLTLIQKEEGSNEIVAQINATIWSTEVQRIKKTNPDLDSYFIAGHEVMLGGTPIFHEKFGLQLRISSIDTAFTRGALDQKREELFNRIKVEGLHEINKTLKLPLAFRNIAIISSVNAAGYIDFINHLQHNPYNLTFGLHLYDIVMQGISIESEMIKSLDQITSGHLEFDAVIIIRGGGSKVDLSGFDNYNLAQKIANYPIPVFTGIGHDIDISSLDLVAHKYFKTPTAVAEYFIETNSSFLGEVHEQVKKILNIAQNAFTHINYDLKSILNNLRNASKDKITGFKYNLDKIKGEIYKSAQIKINHSQFSIESIKQKINLQNPLEILKKGYVIVVQNNKKIKTVKDFDISKPADLNFADGVIKVKH